MSAIPSNSGTTVRSMTVSVLKMQLDQGKQQGAAEQQLIKSAGSVQKTNPAGGNAPGVGNRIDVNG